MLRIVMRQKLVPVALVLMLSAANSPVALMCAAYCSGSAGGALAHHQMESEQTPATTSHHTHAHHHAANCAECPPESRNSLNQSADCASLVQMQALKEGTFSFEAPTGLPHVDVSNAPARALALASDGERFSLFDAPKIVRNSSPVSVPLRI